MTSMNRVAAVETADSAWRDLYRISGAAALATLVLIPVQMIVFIASPPPSTVIDYFTLFQNSKLLGLLTLDLLYVVDNVLLIPVFLALYVALRRASESFIAMGTALGLLGIVALFTSNTSFNMLSLSDQYAAATTDVKRSMLLAAGQAMLATYQGTAYHVSYVLGSVAGIVISAVMLRSNIFSKATAYSGILANVIGLGLFVPTIGICFALTSVVPFLAIWYILIARRLFQLGRAS
ncbi:MAG: DUF4386 family protein [Chloroflexi bacterium]|nr:DUF4386 family protein [Chloroflexota bacterium]